MRRRDVMLEPVRPRLGQRLRSPRRLNSGASACIDTRGRIEQNQPGAFKARLRELGILKGRTVAY